MNTIILLTSISVFLLCLLIHVLLWRVRLPRHRALWLFLVFFFLPPIIWFLHSFLVFVLDLPARYALRVLDGAVVLLLHYALSSAYILSYPAVEALSPTLVIALFLARSNAESDFEDLAGLFPDESILMPRIMDLIESNLVRLDNDTLSLTLRGRILVNFFTIFRSFIGLKQGRG